MAPEERHVALLSEIKALIKGKKVKNERKIKVSFFRQESIIDGLLIVLI